MTSVSSAPTIWYFSDLEISCLCAILVHRWEERHKQVQGSFKLGSASCLQVYFGRNRILDIVLGTDAKINLLPTTFVNKKKVILGEKHAHRGWLWLGILVFSVYVVEVGLPRLINPAALPPEPQPLMVSYIFCFIISVQRSVRVDLLRQGVLDSNMILFHLPHKLNTEVWVQFFKWTAAPESSGSPAK